eukprot:9794222-Alexandrium_andersonii.AAC.1
MPAEAHCPARPKRSSQSPAPERPPEVVPKKPVALNAPAWRYWPLAVKSSSVELRRGVPGAGTMTPSEGEVAGVTGELTCAGRASSTTWPSWYLKEVARRRSSGPT